MEKWGLIENLLPKNQCCICLFINLNFKVRSFPDKNIQKKMCKWAKLVLRYTVNNRDNNFTGNSGHPPRPAPPHPYWDRYGNILFGDRMGLENI